MTVHKKRLGTYLNDHLAGSTAGLELVKRAAGGNEGTEYGAFLSGLVTEIDEDRETLKAIMDSLDIGKDSLKVSLGWAAEKLGRLKLNDSLIGYSPLSRLIEFEGLVLGVTGKRALWVSLREALAGEPAAARFDFDALIARADAQIAGLEELRRRAAVEAVTE